MAGDKTFGHNNRDVEFFLGMLVLILMEMI